MTKIYRQSALRLILTLIVCTLLISCGSEKSAQEGDSAKLGFQLKWPVAKSVGSVTNVPAGVDMIRMSLSGPGMLTKSFDFKVSEYPGGGTVTNVPAGIQRTITFQGFSGPEIIYEKVVYPVTLLKGIPYSSKFDMEIVSNDRSASTVPPAAPSGVSAEAVSSGQINLSWVDNSNNETSYIIERKSGADANYTEIATVAANDTVYSDTYQISSNTTYDYRVLANNGTGSTTGTTATASEIVSASTYSISGAVLAGATVTRSGNGTATITAGGSGNYSFSGVQNGSYILTPAMAGYTFDPPNLVVTVDSGNLSSINFSATAVTVAPYPPTGLKATDPFSNLINFFWTDASDETGYNIYRKAGVDGTYTKIDEVAGNVTTYNDTAVAADTTYYYKLRATNVKGESVDSTELSVTTLVKTYNISGSITSDGLVLEGVTITLTGSGSTTTKTDSSGNYSFIEARDGSYTLTPVSAGYDFTPPTPSITVNGADLSAMNFVATPNSIPTDPTALSASAASSSRINLAWVDNANNETGYKIGRTNVSGGTYELIHTAAANAKSYSDANLSENTTYYYRVWAYNLRGDSGVVETNAKTPVAPVIITPELVKVTGATTGDFYIGKYEVTQGEWQKVMPENPSPSKYKACGPDCPVEMVSFNEIGEFIKRLNSLSNNTKGYRLPTEAEWEYAAQSGGKGEVYSGGSDVNAVAWYSGNSLDTTHTAGTKQANGLGIFDMSGNVWEFVSDWWGVWDYQRVIKGGSYMTAEAGVQTTSRNYRDITAKNNYHLGFRLAASAP